jgi:hypothetical protein
MKNAVAIGRIVIARDKRLNTNGIETAPAIITRVWREQPDMAMVNLSALPDCHGSVEVVSSIELFDTEDAANNYVGVDGRAAWFPPRD